MFGMILEHMILGMRMLWKAISRKAEGVRNAAIEPFVCRVMRAWISSARGQLLILWLLLAISAAATAYLFWQFYSQTAARQVDEGQELAARACGEITDRYSFYTTGWTASLPRPDIKALRPDLTAVVSTALSQFAGVEGGIWSSDEGSLAYAFPTYEGSGQKLDIAANELATIQSVNDQALAVDAAVDRIQRGRSQTLVVHACPLAGPLPDTAAWTMTRVHTWAGPAYNRLMWGLALTAFTLVTSTLVLALVLAGWTRRVARLRQALGEPASLDLPQLPPTGDIDLDRLVAAVNATGDRLQDAQRQAASAERLAAVGRLSAGLAHEIRNPLMAMRLKAENALASGDPERSRTSLRMVLEQITRLETLLRNLLATTQHRPLAIDRVDLTALLQRRAEAHRELADRHHVTLVTPNGASPIVASCDEAEIARAIDNLLINAIEATPEGGEIALYAEMIGYSAVIRIQDEGPGVDAAVAARLFEPFVTSRAEGTGLGLAIVREIARAHRGELRYKPLKKGSLFEIELPCPRS